MSEIIDLSLLGHRPAVYAADIETVCHTHLPSHFPDAQSSQSLESCRSAWLTAFAHAALSAWNLSFSFCLGHILLGLL